MTVTCKEPIEDCEVILHSEDTEEPVTVAYLNSTKRTVEFSLKERANYLAVLTWDSVTHSESFLNSSVSLFKKINTDETSEFVVHL